VTICAAPGSLTISIYGSLQKEPVAETTNSVSTREEAWLDVSETRAHETFEVRDCDWNGAADA
jgi:hypothetical protein